MLAQLCMINLKKVMVVARRSFLETIPAELVVAGAICFEVCLWSASILS